MMYVEAYFDTHGTSNYRTVMRKKSKRARIKFLYWMSVRDQWAVTEIVTNVTVMTHRRSS